MSDIKNLILEKNYIKKSIVCYQNVLAGLEKLWFNSEEIRKPNIEKQIQKTKETLVWLNQQDKELSETKITSDMIFTPKNNFKITFATNSTKQIKFN
jgi:hypothetical protein